MEGKREKGRGIRKGKGNVRRK
jgi:hypothetical protein